VIGLTSGGLSASGASASTSGLKSGKEKVLLNPTFTIFASNSSNNNVNFTGPGTSTPSLGSWVSRQTCSSLAERFTCRPSSSELANGSAGVEVWPRLPPEIHYWVAVIMRNACRKDDFRGGQAVCRS